MAGQMQHDSFEQMLIDKYGFDEMLLHAFAMIFVTDHWDSLIRDEFEEFVADRAKHVQEELAKEEAEELAKEDAEELMANGS